MSYALGRAACLETGSWKRKFIIMRRQDEGRREEKLRFVMAELNITRKSCSLIKEKSIEITFRTGKSSKSTKLILLSFDHKQKTWKMPLRLLLRTVQYVELGAAADHMHFVALRELRAVRLDSRRRKCSQEDKRRFSCAKSIRTSKLALMRSRTKEVHTWNKQNSFETLTHRSPFILAVDVSRAVDGKFLLIKLVCVLTLACFKRVFDRFQNSTEMRAWTTKPKILSACIIACEISSGIPWTAAHICCCNNKPWESHSNRETCRKQALENFSFCIYANCAEMKVLIAAELGKYGIFSRADEKFL